MSLKAILTVLALLLPATTFAQERAYQEGLRPPAIIETPAVISPQQEQNDALGVAIFRRSVAHIAAFIRAGNDLSFNFDKDYRSSSGPIPRTLGPHAKRRAVEKGRLAALDLLIAHGAREKLPTVELYRLQFPALKK